MLKNFRGDGMKVSDEAILAEYNVVNQALARISNAHDTLFIFSFTAAGAMLSFAVQQSNPYIALITLIVLLVFRFRVMWYRDAYLHQASYLSVIIEPSLKLSGRIKKKVPETGISQVHYFSYSLLGAGSIGVHFLYNPLYSCNNWFAFSIGIILLIFVIAMDLFYVLRSSATRKRYEQEWETVKVTSKKSRKNT